MFNLKAEELDNKDPTNNGNIYILVFEEEIVVTLVYVLLYILHLYYP